jgi:hypothetical protein
MAGVADEDPVAKHNWNVLALREAEAFSHLRLGEEGEALRFLRLARSHFGALEPGPYADRVNSAITMRLEELEARAGDA